MIKKILLLLLVSICVLNARVIKLTTGEWPPFTSKGIIHNGLAIQIVTEAFALEGIKAEYGFFPWKRAYKLADRGGEWEGSAVWFKTTEREKSFYYSSEPVIIDKTVFFHRKDLDFKWKTIDDLKSYKIGAAIGYYYGSRFKAAEEDGLINVLRARNDEHNIKMLLRERVDLYVSNIQVGYYLISKQKKENSLMLTNNPRTLHEMGVYLIISKTVPDGKELMDKFDKGLKKLKETGRYDQILDIY